MHPKFYQNLLDQIREGIYFVDTDRTIKYWNAEAERLSGYLKSDVLGSRCADNILRHVDSSGNNLCNNECPLSATLHDGKNRETEVYMHHKEGHRVPVSIRVTPIHNESGEIVGAVEAFCSNAKNAYAIEQLKKLRREVMIDRLTNIGNRRYADITLENLLREMCEQGVQFGVLMLDIDFFKKVNDTHGHNVGDRVLVMFAQTISNGLRALDIPCRWGGEEFIVLLPNVDSTILSTIAERLRMLIEESYIIKTGQTISVTVSIGGTICRKDDNLKSIVDRADKQLYRSKKSGKNCVHINV